MQTVLEMSLSANTHAITVACTYMQGDLQPGPSQLTEVLLISCNSDTPMAMQGNAIYLIPLLVKLHHGTFAVLLLRACTQFLKPS